MEEGYHVIGHALLDYWEEEARTHPSDAKATRILRDVRLLVALLDHSVVTELMLVEAIRSIKTERLDNGHNLP